MLEIIKKYFQNNNGKIPEQQAENAYDLWSSSYDSQPGNLMLILDEIVFSEFLNEINIHGKKVADIGCGTGRHWQKIFEKHPALLTGFDVSEGMLSKLKKKFPSSSVEKIVDNSFQEAPDGFYDVIISTLTVAHIENIREALFAWSRILKNGGEIIITDFHPALLARGGKRTFRVDQQQFAVTNFVHAVVEMTSILQDAGISVIKLTEKRIDESLKHYYEQQNALDVFKKYKDEPVIYGLHAKKNDN
jgi:ubiquinone/menaquinone biosynthesis C-methylase UbiE